MRKQTKIWLITAACLITLGLITFATVMTVYNWDFYQLSTVKFETNTYKLNNDFSKISINTATADILFAPSGDHTCKVVCYEPEKMKHSVDVQNDTLIISEVDDRDWYEYIGISIGSPKITVYLPKTQYDSVTIKADTGNIEIPNIFVFESIDISASTGNIKCTTSSSGFIKIKTSTGNISLQSIYAMELDLSVSTGHVTVADAACVGDIKINVSTGKASVTDVTCKNMVSTGNTGDITLKNTLATDLISIKRTTGDVRFDCCDAAELSVQTDTGDVTGSFLTDKTFIVETDTGNVSVPKTTGGKCEIRTNTGDIKTSIE